MEEYTCIVCPNSCRITVSETKQGLEIHGNQCVRGADFARKEHTEPMRMFTSTIQLEGGWLRRLPVITDGEVHKANIQQCQTAVEKLVVHTPVHCGDVLVSDFCGEGVNLLAARTFE